MDAELVMGLTLRGRWQGARRGDALVLMCLLVLALCLTHQLLMVTARHLTVMGPLHERGILSPSPAPTAMTILSGAGELNSLHLPVVPQPMTGECPAQQAIVPVLLVLILLAVFLRLGRGPALPTVSRYPAFGLCDFLPPPLTPARRRALLQIFII